MSGFPGFPPVDPQRRRPFIIRAPGVGHGYFVMLVLTFFVVICVTGTWVDGHLQPVNPTAASVYVPGSWRESGFCPLHRLHDLMFTVFGTNSPVESQPADLHGLFCVGLGPWRGPRSVDLTFFTFLWCTLLERFPGRV